MHDEAVTAIDDQILQLTGMQGYDFSKLGYKNKNNGLTIELAIGDNEIYA